MSMKRPISGNHYLEQHNDDMVEELSSKISTLKRVTIAIGDDVREQNRLLSEMVCDDGCPIIPLIALNLTLRIPGSICLKEC